MTASPDELSRWLGTQSGTKVAAHIATADADLSEDLKLSLANVKRHKRKSR
jgi:hypothetical protein